MGNQHTRSGHRATSTQRDTCDGDGDAAIPTDSAQRNSRPTAELSHSLPAYTTSRCRRNVLPSFGAQSSARRPHTRQSPSPTLRLSEAASGVTTRTATAAPPPPAAAQCGPLTPSASSTIAVVALSRPLASSSPEHQTLRDNEDEEGNNEASLNADRRTSRVPSSRRIPHATLMGVDEAPSGLTSEASTFTIPMGPSSAAQQIFLNTAPTTIGAATETFTTTHDGAVAAGEKDNHNGGSSSSSQGGNGNGSLSSNPPLRRTLAAAAPSQQPVEEPLLLSPIVRSSRQASISAARIAVAEDTEKDKDKRTTRLHSLSLEARSPAPPSKSNSQSVKKLKKQKAKNDEGAATPSSRHSGGTDIGDLFNPRSSKFLFRKASSLSSAAANKGERKKPNADIVSPSLVGIGDAGAPTFLKAKSTTLAMAPPAVTASLTAPASPPEGKAEDSGVKQQSCTDLDDGGVKTSVSEIPCQTLPPPFTAATPDEASTSSYAGVRPPPTGRIALALDKANASTAVITDIVFRSTDSTRYSPHRSSGVGAGRGAVSVLPLAQRNNTGNIDTSQPSAADFTQTSDGAERKHNKKSARANTPDQRFEDEDESAGGAGVLVKERYPSEYAIGNRETPFSPVNDRAQKDEEQDKSESEPIARMIETGKQEEQRRVKQLFNRDFESHGERLLHGGEDDDRRNSASRDSASSHSTASTSTNFVPVFPPSPTASFAEPTWDLNPATLNAAIDRRRTGTTGTGSAALSMYDSSVGPNWSPIYPPRNVLYRGGRGAVLFGATTITDTTARVSPRSPYSSPPPHSIRPAGGGGSSGNNTNNNSIQFLSPHLVHTDTEAQPKGRKAVSQSAIVAAWNRMGARSGAPAASSTFAMIPGGGRPNANTNVNSNSNNNANHNPEEFSPVTAVIGGGASTSSTASTVTATSSNAVFPSNPTDNFSPTELPSHHAGKKENGTAPPGACGAGVDRRDSKSSLLLKNGIANAAFLPQKAAFAMPIRRKTALTRQRNHPALLPPPPSPPRSPTGMERAVSMVSQLPLDAAGPHRVAVAVPGTAGASHALTEAAEETSIERQKAKKVPDTLGEYGKTSGNSRKGVPHVATCALLTFGIQEEAAVSSSAHKALAAQEMVHRQAIRASPPPPSQPVESEAATTHSYVLSGLVDFAEDNESSVSGSYRLPHTTEDESKDAEDVYYAHQAHTCGSAKPGEKKGRARRTSSALPSPKNATVTPTPLGPPSPHSPPVYLSSILSPPAGDVEESSQQPPHVHRLLHPPQRDTHVGLEWRNPSSLRSTEVTALLSGLRHRDGGERRAHSAVEKIKDEESGEILNSMSNPGAMAAATAAVLSAERKPVLSAHQLSQQQEQWSTTATACEVETKSNNTNGRNANYPYQRLSSPKHADASHSDPIRSTGLVVAAGGVRRGSTCRQQQPCGVSSASSARWPPCWRERLTPTQGQPTSPLSSHTTRDDGSNPNSTANNNGGDESGENASLAGSRRRRLSNASQGPPPLAQYLSTSHHFHRELSGSWVHWKDVSLLTGAVGTPYMGTTQLSSREDEELRRYRQLQRHGYPQNGNREEDESEEEQEQDEEETAKAEELQRMRPQDKHHAGADLAQFVERGGDVDEPFRSWGSAPSSVVCVASSAQLWQREAEDEDEEEGEDEEQEDMNYYCDARDSDVQRSASAAAAVARRHSLRDPPYSAYHREENVSGSVHGGARRGRYGHFRDLSPRSSLRLYRVSPSQEVSLLCTPLEGLSHGSDARSRSLESPNTNNSIILVGDGGTALADNASRLPLTQYEPPMPSNRNTFTAFVSLSDISSKHLLASGTAVFHGGRLHQQPQDNSEEGSSSSSSKPTSGAATDGSGEAATTTGNGFSTEDTPLTADTLLMIGNSNQPVQHRRISFPNNARAGGGGSASERNKNNSGGAIVVECNAQINSPLFSSVSTASTNRISRVCSPVQGLLPLVAQLSTLHSGKVEGGRRAQGPRLFPQTGNGEEELKRGERKDDETPTLSFPRRRKSSIARSQLLRRSPALLPSIGLSKIAEVSTTTPFVIQQSPQLPRSVKSSFAEAATAENVTPSLATNSPHVSSKMDSGLLTANATIATTTVTIPASASVMTFSGSTGTSAVADRSRKGSGVQSSSNNDGADFSGTVDANTNTNSKKSSAGSGGVLLVGRQDTTLQSGERDVGICRYASAKTFTAKPSMALPMAAMVRRNSEPTLPLQLHCNRVLYQREERELPWWNRSRQAQSEGSEFIAEYRTTTHGSENEESSNSSCVIGSPLSLSTTPPKLLATVVQPDGEYSEAGEGRGSLEPHHTADDAGDHLFQEEMEKDTMNNGECRKRKEKQQRSDKLMGLPHLKLSPSFAFDEDERADQGDNFDDDDERPVEEGMHDLTWRRGGPLLTSFPQDTKPTSLVSPVPALSVVEVPLTLSFLEEADNNSHRNGNNSEDEEREGSVRVEERNVEEEQAGDDLHDRDGSTTNATALSVFVAHLGTLLHAETYTRACIQDSAEDALETWRSVWSTLQQPAFCASPNPLWSTLPPRPSITAAIIAGREEAHQGEEGREEEVNAQGATSLSSPVAPDSLTRPTSAPHSPSSAVLPLSVPQLTRVDAAKTTAATTTITAIQSNADHTTVASGGTVAGEEEDCKSDGAGETGHVDVVVFNASAPLGEEEEETTTTTCVLMSVPVTAERRDVHLCTPSPLEAALDKEDAASHQDKNVAQGEKNNGKEDSPVTTAPFRLHAGGTPRYARAAASAAAPLLNPQHTGGHEPPSYCPLCPSTARSWKLNSTLSTKTEEEGDDRAEPSGRFNDPSKAQAAPISSEQPTQPKQERTEDGGVTEDTTTPQPINNNCTDVHNGEIQGDSALPMKSALLPSPLPPTPPSSFPILDSSSLATVMKSTADASPNTRQSSPEALPPCIFKAALINSYHDSNDNKAHTTEAVPLYSPLGEEEEEGRSGGISGSSSARQNYHLSAARTTSPSPRSPQLQIASALPRPGFLAKRSHSSTPRRPSVVQAVCRWCGMPYTSAVVCPVAQRTHQVLREERKREKMAKRQAQALLGEGRIVEGVALLKEVGLYVP